MAQAQTEKFVHQLVYRLVVGGEFDVLYHIVAHRSSLEIEPLLLDIAHKVALGPDADNMPRIHNQDGSYFVGDHGVQCLGNSRLGRNADD